MGDFLFGDSGGVSYTQAPEQRQMYQALMPGAARIGGAAATGGSLWDVPLPQQMYQVPGYQPYLPTQGWYGGLDPSIQAGLWEPYNYGAQQMLEQMGGAGQLGSARGGMSGAAGAALGKYYSDASKDVGLMGWNMTAPYMNQAIQNQWQALLGREQFYGNQLMGALQAPYGMIPGMMGGTYSQPVVEQPTQGIFQSVAPFAALGGLSMIPGMPNFFG